ncbi:beta strand repeat-containing protein, partial [Aquimarina gracilis]|uniref:beta strand repeat-containing protein n=1 Tax=Aquimarina gracilis TaxID=874422 RepID=UPI003CD08F07
MNNIKILAVLSILIIISSKNHAQVVTTWGGLSGVLPENNYPTSSLSAIGDGVTFVNVDITRSPSATVGGVENAVPPSLILANSFNNTRATVGVSGNTYTYVFSEPVHVILSSQEHSDLVRTENIKVSSPDAGVVFTGSLTGAQTGHFINNNNTSEIHIGSNASITAAGTYWTVQSNIAITTLTVEYYVTDPAEAASGEPFTLDLAPVPYIRLDDTNITGAGGIDINVTGCAKSYEILDNSNTGATSEFNAPHGLDFMTVTLVNPQDVGQEELSIAGTFDGITVSGNGTTSLTITNVSSDVNTLRNTLDDLVYKNSAAIPEIATPRIVEVTVTDPFGNTSATATTTVSLSNASSSGSTAGPLIVFTTGSTVDLFTGLDGSEDTGGTWVDVDATGSLVGNTVTIAALPLGPSRFNYTVTGTTPCSDETTTVVVLNLDGSELSITAPVTSSNCGTLTTNYSDPTFSANSDDPIHIFDGGPSSGELECPAGGAGTTYDWYIFNPLTNSYDDFAIGSTRIQTGLDDGGYLVVRNDGGTIEEGRAWVWNNTIDTDAGTNATACIGDTVILSGVAANNSDYTYYNPVPRPFVITASTIISVEFNITHTYISDVAYYLVSPDGAVTIPLGLNEPGVACNASANAVGLVFTNDPAAVTTLPNFDICEFNRNNACANVSLSGTYNSYYTDPSNSNAFTCTFFAPASGPTAIDMSALAGYDARQGGWKVQVYDCEPADTGEIDQIIITFDDGAGTTQIFDSGTIPNGTAEAQINDNSCDPLTASIYEVPFSGSTSAIEEIGIQDGIGTDSSGGYEWSYSTVGPTGPFSAPFENATLTPAVVVNETTWFRLRADNGSTCSGEDVVQITVTDSPNSGTGTDEFACAGDALVDLNTLITDADMGGIWSVSVTSPDAPGGDFNAGAGTYDPTTGGVYVFDYTVNATAPCTINAVTSVTVSVQAAPNTGINNTVNANGASGVINLFSELLGTPETGGTWSLDTGGDDPGANFDQGLGTLDSSGLAGGTYIFQYTLTNCTTAMSAITVIFSAVDTDMDGVGDAVDFDDDNDGILDTAENSLGVDPSADADMDGIPNYQDFDNNGTATAPVCLDGDLNGICDTLDPVFDNDQDGVPNHYDLDSDNDGIYDVIETGGTDGDNDGRADDFDGDATNDNGIPDSANGGTGISTPTNSDSSGDADYLVLDSDGDGCDDVIEAGFTDGDDNGLLGSGTFGIGLTVDGNGVVTSGIDGYTTPVDADTDTIADYQQVGGPDADNDGISDACDLTFDNNDGDTVGDNLDLDDDNDGIPDTAENSLGVDPSADTDADGIPNYQDFTDNGSLTAPDCTDADANGICDTLDPVFDFDGDGVPNHFDLDSDNDGITDIIEAGGVDTDFDGIIDGFSDGNNDGLDDTIAGAPLPLTNTDGTGNANFLDIDADDDGIVDNIEAQATAAYLPPFGNDTDNDGIDDRYDVDCSFGTCGIAGTPIVPTNTDGLGDGADYIDLDSDDDGENDTIEGYDTNDDGVADTILANNDSDGDGLDDNFDVDGTSTTDAGGVTNGGQTAGNPFPDTDSPGGEPDWRDPVVNDLEITKVDTYVDTNTNGIIDVGDTINYVFVITNNGTATLTNINVSDPTVTVAGGPIATLAATTSDNSTFTGSYTIQAGDITAGSFSNTATVSAEDPNGNTISSLSDDPDDPSDATDDDNDGNPDDATVTDLRQPLLDITKTDTYVDVDSNGIINAGDRIDYVFEVTNTGNVDLTGISVSDMDATITATL